MDVKQSGSNLKSRLASLYAYMSKRLHIKQSPGLKLINNVSNADKPYGMTGYYDHENKHITVYITNRHPTDILRSFAHEVIHHWQNEHGQLAGHDNTEHYTQKDPHLRKKEMEAYLLGNILFRDWQDENRYGTPETPPFLISLNENLNINDPTGLRELMKRMIKAMIAKNIIGSYHREKTSGDMNINDFVEDIAHKLSSELGRQIELINNRGNWENQTGGMIKESVEVSCKNCGHWNCNYSLLPEVQMGVVRCPNCKMKMDQEGNNYVG